MLPYRDLRKTKQNQIKIRRKHEWTEKRTGNERRCSHVDNLYFCWPCAWTSAWYLVLHVSSGYNIVVLNSDPMAPDVASVIDSRSTPIYVDIHYRACFNSITLVKSGFDKHGFDRHSSKEIEKKWVHGKLINRWVGEEEKKKKTRWRKRRDEKMTEMDCLFSWDFKNVDCHGVVFLFSVYWLNGDWTAGNYNFICTSLFFQIKKKTFLFSI